MLRSNESFVTAGPPTTLADFSSLKADYNLSTFQYFDRPQRQPNVGRNKVRNYFQENLKWSNGQDPWLDRINSVERPKTETGNVDQPFVEHHFVGQRRRRRMRRRNRNGFMRRRQGDAAFRNVDENTIDDDEQNDNDDDNVKNNNNDINNTNNNINGEQVMSKILNRDAIVVGGRQTEFYGSSPGSGSYPKYYYENAPATAAVAPENAKIVERVEEGFFTKIQGFIESFFSYFTPDKNVDKNVDRISDVGKEDSSKDEILERADEPESGSSLSKE